MSFFFASKILTKFTHFLFTVAFNETAFANTRLSHGKDFQPFLTFAFRSLFFYDGISKEKLTSEPELSFGY
jgi:hypothetical protein